MSAGRETFRRRMGVYEILALETGQSSGASHDQ